MAFAVMFWVVISVPLFIWIGLSLLNYSDEQTFLSILVTVLFYAIVGIVGHQMANERVDTNYADRLESIESVTELPPQTLTFEGKTIDVVVIANKHDEHIDVRRINDILPYAITPETKLYLVKERGYFWGPYYISPKESILDTNPLTQQKEE